MTVCQIAAALSTGSVHLPSTRLHASDPSIQLSSPGVFGRCARRHVGHPFHVPRSIRTVLVRAGPQSSNSSKALDEKKSSSSTSVNSVPAQKVADALEDAEDEMEEEESWLEERIDTAIELTASVVRAVPGPRVSKTDVPWLLAVPLAYLGITFVWSIFSLVRKRNTPQAKRRRQVGKNAYLVESLDAYFPKKRESFDRRELKQLESQTGFDSMDVLRKYLRYALNEKPFTPEVVADLLHLRQVAGLENYEVADVLNDVARRTVKAKGAVLMDTTGMTEKGIKRKAAVQGIFTKLLYLSEMEQFCSAAVSDKVELKTIFGVTDEDSDLIRIDTISDLDTDYLEKMVKGSEDEGIDQDDDSGDGDGDESEEEELDV